MQSRKPCRSSLTEQTRKESIGWLCVYCTCVCLRLCATALWGNTCDTVDTQMGNKRHWDTHRINCKTIHTLTQSTVHSKRSPPHAHTDRFPHTFSKTELDENSHIKRDRVHACVVFILTLFHPSKGNCRHWKRGLCYSAYACWCWGRFQSWVYLVCRQYLWPGRPGLILPLDQNTASSPPLHSHPFPVP